MPTAAYRKLALATVVATFVLVVVGGFVRVSDSGLGCGPKGSGFHGWPFCNGDVVPGIDLNSVIEYTHRAVAGIVTILILSLAVLAWRNYRSQRRLLWATTGAFLLVVSQAVLGGATVEEGLAPGYVAAHLGLAMLLLGTLIYAWQQTRPAAETVSASSGVRALSIAASVLVFATIVAGGYMAGTQKYGRADYRLGDGAHHACGKEFPTCNGGFMPFGESRLVDIHLTHRAFMYLTTLVLLVLVAVLLRRRPSDGAVRSAQVLLALLVVQLVLGALNVWLDEYEGLIVAHLAAGTLLWAVSIGLTLQLFRVPAPAPFRHRAEAVPA
ncbi:MAG TPA: COX15/CtaA family protein [Thermoleophilaceae bacterium]